MQPMGIHDLLKQARAGDRQALDELLLLVRPWLERTARGFAEPDRPDASVSDLVQQAWLRAWQKLDQFRGGADEGQTLALLQAWLGQIVRRLGLNARRDQRAERRRPPGGLASLDGAALDPPADGSRPSANVRAEEQARLIGQALARLEDAEDGEIVRLRFFEGLSLRQIAARLGRNHETVRQRFQAVMKRLERELGELA